MPSRQDQLHSYQFMVQRVVAALVMRETDPAQSPFRRAAVATLASVLVAGIALAGIAVFGLIVGGGATDWRDTKAVIIEKETGAVFVYRDDRLHPVLNYASALLIVGESAPKRVTVSRKSIDGVARGTPLGISDAPDSLPDAKHLVRAPWTLCSAQTSASNRTPRSILLVGAGAGDSAVTSGEPLGDKAVVAREPGGALQLIWHNHRHRVRNQQLVLTALSWTSQQIVQVAPALLNAIPAGADLKPIGIPDEGEPSTALPDQPIGTVIKVTNATGAKQYALVVDDGVAQITELQALLILGQQEAGPKEFNVGQYQGLRKADSLVPQNSEDALPATVPTLLTPEDGTVCAVVRDDSGVSEVRVSSTVPDASDAVRTGGRTEGGTPLADLVAVEPGHGAVVESVAAPGAKGGALSLVTDLGVRYAIPSREVLGMLGYGDVDPVRMPASLVSLVEPGHALDPSSARKPVVRG